VRPSPHGTLPAGVFSYVVGRNLLFATQDLRTISAVALYKGLPNNQLRRNFGPQSWANFISANETPCR